MEGFRDPNTGLFDPELLKSTLANLRDNRETTPEAIEQWLNWEDVDEDVAVAIRGTPDYLAPELLVESARGRGGGYMVVRERL
jgi:DNA-binding IscR family transcriptional regulator